MPPLDHPHEDNRFLWRRNYASALGPSRCLNLLLMMSVAVRTYILYAVAERMTEEGYAYPGFGAGNVGHAVPLHQPDRQSLIEEEGAARRLLNSHGRRRHPVTRNRIRRRRCALVRLVINWRRISYGRLLSHIIRCLSPGRHCDLATLATPTYGCKWGCWMQVCRRVDWILCRVSCTCSKSQWNYFTSHNSTWGPIIAVDVMLILTCNCLRRSYKLDVNYVSAG